MSCKAKQRANLGWLATLKTKKAQKNFTVVFYVLIWKVLGLVFALTLEDAGYERTRNHGRIWKR